MGFSLKKAIGSSLETFGGDIGNVVAGAFGIGSDQLAAEENYKWQKKASDYAYNQNLQMWNLANAYNDPSAQMERLKAAGLNSNLVYGGGNVTGNTSGSTPTYERANAGYTDRGIQRQQLAMAMKDHQQRITNQAIENDLARQRLVLAERDADRSDKLAEAQIGALKANLGLRSDEMDISSGIRRDTLAWRKYQDALNIYEKKFNALPWPIRNDPVKANKVMGKRPMYMDYLD